MPHLLLWKLVLAALVVCSGLLFAHCLDGRRGLLVAALGASFAFGGLYAITAHPQVAAASHASR